MWRFRLFLRPCVNPKQSKAVLSFYWTLCPGQGSAMTRKGFNLTHWISVVPVSAEREKKCKKIIRINCLFFFNSFSLVLVWLILKFLHNESALSQIAQKHQLNNQVSESFYIFTNSNSFVLSIVILCLNC